MTKILLGLIIVCRVVPIVCMEEQKKFFKAVKEGDINLVKDLKDKVDLNKRNLDDIFLVAVKGNNIPMAKVLLDLGADIHSGNSETPLGVAIEQQNAAMIRALLYNARELDIDKVAVRQRKGDYLVDKSPLVLAFETHNSDVIKSILTEVPDPNPDIVILEKLANTQDEKKLFKIAKDQYKLYEVLTGFKPELDLIKRTGTPDVLQSKILSRVRNPLSAAILENNFGMVKYFIEKGIDVNQLLNGGTSFLQQAIYSANSAIVEFLLEKGANPNLSPDIFSLTPLLMALPNDKMLEILKKKLDVNYKMPFDGETNLMLAVRRKDRFAVDQLLKLGADPLIKNDEGETAYDIAQRLEGKASKNLDDKKLFQDILNILKPITSSTAGLSPSTMPPETVPLVSQSLLWMMQNFTQALKGLQSVLLKK